MREPWKYIILDLLTLVRNLLYNLNWLSADLNNNKNILAYICEFQEMPSLNDRIERLFSNLFFFACLGLRKEGTFEHYI